MKKTILILSIVTTFFTTHLSAIEPLAVPKQIELSFNKEFGTVKNVSWKQVNNVYIGTFGEGSTTFYAYFQEDGVMSGVGRFISIDQMPLCIDRSRSVQSFLNNYKITGIFEYVPNERDGIYYFVQFENSTKLIIAKVYANGETEIIKKQKK